MRRAGPAVALLAVATIAAIADRDGAGPPPATAQPGPGRAVRVEHRALEEAPTLGPPVAPVTIELFYAPGTAQAHAAYLTLVELQRRHPVRVRAVFRPLPRSGNVAAVLLAAHLRGRFHELMGALAVGPGTPTAAAVLDLAVKAGLPRAAAERAHLDDRVQGLIDLNRHRAFRLGTTSSPELVVNGRPLGGRPYPGSASVGDLEKIYLAALEDARRAEGEGVPLRALVAWGARAALCGDEPEELTPAPGAPVTAEAAEPPRFAWHLGRLLTRGTGCAVARHLPATLDELDRDSPPDRAPPLLARPLPTAGMPAFGPGDAPVPIHVVCNLRGRFCLDQLDLARRVAEHHPGQVRVVWVPWVDLALDDAGRDLTLAQAALCAVAEGDGWGFLRAATTAGIAGRGRIDLTAVAAAAGLDAERLVACAATTEPARAAVEAARAAGVGWGPTVVIGGRAYLGGFGDDRRASDRVEAELAPGLLESMAPAW